MGVITWGGFCVNRSNGEWFSSWLPWLAPLPPPPSQRTPSPKDLTKLNAEGTETSAFAVGAVEPLCIHACGTVFLPTQTKASCVLT